MNVCELGLVPYQEAWNLQKELAKQRARDEIPDTLLLLQHPPTYTLGSAGKLDHLLMDEAERNARGVEVLHVDRGGDITYHGPGQLVGYPILQLQRGQLRMDVIAYIRELEAILIEVLATFDIAAQRLEDYTGVWVPVGDHLEKIAAIGIKVTAKGVTQHGFALNVCPDMDYFGGIIPCGIDDKPVTSMALLRGNPLFADRVAEPPPMEAVAAQIIKAFSLRW